MSKLILQRWRLQRLHFFLARSPLACAGSVLISRAMCLVGWLRCVMNSRALRVSFSMGRSFPPFGAVHVTVAEDGTIEEATATGGDPLLRKAAVVAVGNGGTSLPESSG